MCSEEYYSTKPILYQIIPPPKKKKKHFPISKQNVCLLQLIPHNFG